MEKLKWLFWVDDESLPINSVADDRHTCSRKDL